MRKLAAALTILTVIPVPGFNPEAKDIAASKPFIPFIGLLIGAAAYGIAIFLNCHFSPLISAMIMVIFLALISRCFHLDGLADSADGMLSSRSRERMLEIMRDSHIGTMGVFAIVATLGLKAAAFCSIPAYFFPVIALLTPLFGRYSIIIYCHFSNYARETGMGKVMFENKSWLNLLWCTAFTAAIAWYFLGITGILILSGTILFSLFWVVYTRFKLGGATGDTIGANVEITEMLVPLLFIIIAM
jgi:adenosylcobinamide-GDP ribazoletransferase